MIYQQEIECNAIVYVTSHVNQFRLTCILFRAEVTSLKTLVRNTDKIISVFSFCIVSTNGNTVLIVHSNNKKKKEPVILKSRMFD